MCALSGWWIHVLTGTVDTLIAALAKQKDRVKDLTVVSNNVGSGELGLGA